MPGSPAWIAEGNIANAHMGVSVASAGDFDGDGLNDVVIGAAAHDGSRRVAFAYRAIPVGGDGEPCFVGVPTALTWMDRVGDDAVHLGWNEIVSADWYEVMRCDAATGPCSLLSLVQSDSTGYIDATAWGSGHCWHRIIAMTAPASEACPLGTYCYLPDGKCAGAGTCSLHPELCPPVFEDPVCGCSGSGHLDDSEGSSLYFVQRWCTK